MLKDGRVQLAEPDYNVSYLESGMSFKFDSNSVLNPSAASSAASNQWVWSKTSLNKAKAVSQGNNVTLAILDTGVNYALAQFNGKVTTGYSVFDGADGMDVNGHGTFVAGVVNQVAPQARIIPVRVLDVNGTGSMSGVINGVNYAVTHGAKIINMSFSTPTYSKVLEKLIKSLAAKDVVVVAAVGNDNSSSVYYPAGFEGVLAVGGTDVDDNKAAFSNFGTYLGLGAPSTTIYSYWWKGGYAWGDGTSFAAPIAGGAAALYRSMHPWTTAQTTRQVLEGAVDAYPLSCSICADSNSLGSGRLNLMKVVTS
jgi:subtilisin family serine protease